MVPWLDAILVVVLALAIDRYIGEVPNSVHPLRWMGNILAAIDRHVGCRGSRKAVLIGFLSYLLVFILFAGIGLLFTSLVRYGLSETVSPLAGEIAWIVLTAVLFKVSFAIFSFRKHCDPICADLDAGRTEDAAAKVQMIVSRNTKGMDAEHIASSCCETVTENAEHIASSCCETVTENLVDSVYSPVLYFGILGLPGAVMFRCANLMDAMWGYLNDKLGMDWRASVPAAKAEHTMTPSPNSGWSMTAAAAVLGISMEKRGVYVMNGGHPMPTTDDVRRCCRLIELSAMIYLLLVGIILYGLIGIQVQLFVEDAVFGFWGSVF